MKSSLRELQNHQPVANRIEALRTLTKLLSLEVESLNDVAPHENLADTDEPTDLNHRVQRFEITLICNALLAANGNQRRAAAMLGMKTSTLHAKIKRFEIDTFVSTAKPAERKGEDES